MLYQNTEVGLRWGNVARQVAGSQKATERPTFLDQLKQLEKRRGARMRLHAQALLAFGRPIEGARCVQRPPRYFFASGAQRTICFCSIRSVSVSTSFFRVDDVNRWFDAFPFWNEICALGNAESAKAT